MAEQAPVVNEPVVADTTPTDSTPVENTAEVAESAQETADKEVAESLAKQETDSEEPAVNTPAEEAPAEETSEEQPQGKAEERKQQLNSEIRDLVARRNEIKAQVEKLNGQVYQPATGEELVEQGMSPEMAEIEVMKQEREIERYNTQVAESQLTIEHESNKVLNDFPIFDPDSAEYRPEIAASAAKILKANLVTDPNTGQVIASNVSPYELYQSFAEAVRLSAEQGQIKGQQATERMLARVDSTPNAAPAKETEKDLFLKGLLGEQ
jgi:subtilase family serine protease